MSCTFCVMCVGAVKSMPRSCKDVMLRIFCVMCAGPVENVKACNAAPVLCDVCRSCRECEGL